MLPEGWKKQIVGELFDVQLGKMLNKEAKQKQPQLPYLTNFNIRWGSFYTQKLNTMFFSEKDREKFALKQGDLIVCEGGEVGRCAIWDARLSPCYYQKALHRLRPKADILPEYFQTYMESISGTKLLEDYTSRTSIAHLTREKLLTLPVRVPPFPEQKKIARILSTWDKAIETVEKLIRNSKAQKKALMQQLLTGKRRLPKFDKEWKNTPLEKLIVESRISGTTGDIAQKITIKLYGKGVVPKNEKRPGSQSTRYYKRKSGQFIYSKLDFLNGAFGIIPKELDGFESTLDLPAFDFKTGVEPVWFINFVSREEFYSANLSLANGGRKARRVNPKDLLNLKVPLPSYPEQQKIAALLTIADKEIETLQQKFDCLKQEKNALMQQLLTGKRRVKVNG